MTVFNNSARYLHQISHLKGGGGESKDQDDGLLKTTDVLIARSRGARCLCNELTPCCLTRPQTFLPRSKL
eukprot:scaffold437_cov159-Amphora_coffeaeformis.AAC.12